MPGHPGLRNVVGRIPGTRPAIAIAAHYDTKDLPGFVGANDGAAGTAAVVELRPRAARRRPRRRGAPELRFVLFDGEEATDDRRPFLATGLRGSKAYATRHAGELRALILLDFVAGKRDADPARGVVGPRPVGRLRRAAARGRRRRRVPRGRGQRRDRRPHAVPGSRASRRST